MCYEFTPATKKDCNTSHRKDDESPKYSFGGRRLAKMRPTMEGGAGAEGTETLHSDEITLIILKGFCYSEIVSTTMNKYLVGLTSAN